MLSDLSSDELTYNIRPAWRYEWPFFFKMLIGLSMLFISSNSIFVRTIEKQLLSFDQTIDLALYLHILGVSYAIWSFFRALVSHYQHKYHIGRSGVESRLGIISRDERRAEYSNVSYVRLSQSAFARIFGVGDVLVGTSATDEPEVVLYGVGNPSRWKGILQHRIGSH